MNSQTLATSELPPQTEPSLPKEFEKFSTLSAHLSAEGVLVEKKGEEIMLQLNTIHNFLYEVGIQANTEDFLNQLTSMNQVVADIMQDGEPHMYDDIHFALDLFIRKNCVSNVPTIAKEVFARTDAVLAS